MRDRGEIPGRQVGVPNVWHQKVSLCSGHHSVMESSISMCELLWRTSTHRNRWSRYALGVVHSWNHRFLCLSSSREPSHIEIDGFALCSGISSVMDSSISMCELLRRSSTHRNRGFHYALGVVQSWNNRFLCVSPSGRPPHIETDGFTMHWVMFKHEIIDFYVSAPPENLHT